MTMPLAAVGDKTMTIDLREFDQREHGTRAAALKVELLEPEADPALAQWIREQLDQHLDRQRAAECVERYRRDQVKRRGTR